MDLEITPRTLRFRDPVHAAYGRLEERPLLEVALRGRDGTVGRGEAAPLQPYDGVALEGVRAELESCRDALAAGDDLPRSELLAACGERCSHPQALAAIDLALWDLEGRRRGRPLAELLAEHPAAEVPVNATITEAEPGRVRELVASAAGAGFRCVKVKVGHGDDAARVAAARAGGGAGVAMRVDANGAWSVPEAVRALRALAPHGIELCEEPVHGTEALRAVRESVGPSVPIAMDETVARDPGAAGSGATQYVCLKVAACGGVTGLLEAAAAARGAGSRVYVASTFDGPAGIAAGLHAAAALDDLPPCGLATLDLFADVADAFPHRRGAIAVPSGPGLGLG